MNLLADENVPRGTVAGLRALGWDVAWIQETRPGMGDREVIDLARREGRILLTFDKDFGELAFRLGLPEECGIVLIRLRESSPTRMQERVTGALVARDNWRGLRGACSLRMETIFTRGPCRWPYHRILPVGMRH